MNISLNSKQKATLQKIYDKPTRSDIKWTDIEKLLLACQATISQGRGSRVRVTLHHVRATFHTPHPEKEAVKGMVEAIRDFLKEAGITPDSV